MKKTFLSLLALSAMLVACGPSKTYIAIEKATTDASVALDTVASAMVIEQIATTWQAACNDAISTNGELKGDEEGKATELQTNLKEKVKAKSDSLQQALLETMTIVTISEPEQGDTNGK